MIFANDIVQIDRESISPADFHVRGREAKPEIPASRRLFFPPLFSLHTATTDDHPERNSSRFALVWCVVAYRPPSDSERTSDGSTNRNKETFSA